MKRDLLVKLRRADVARLLELVADASDRGDYWAESQAQFLVRLARIQATLQLALEVDSD